MFDTVTTTMQEAAQEAYDAFERVQRGDETITTLRDDRPQWVFDAVYSAHGAGKFLPDDWRYKQIRAAFGAVADADEDADLQETGDNFADEAVDTYTRDRLTWLASNLNRPGYCDEFLSEFGADAFEDTIQLVGMGQYMEACEIWQAVLSALDSHCEETADANDD